MRFNEFSKKKKLNFYWILFSFLSGIIFFIIKGSDWRTFIPLTLFMIIGLTTVVFMPNSFWEGRLMEEIDRKNYKAYQIVIAVLSICLIGALLLFGLIFLI